MKRIYYPEEPKETLFERGYIARKSGHSRGSTIDLTLIRLSKNKSSNKFAESGLTFKEEAVDCREQKNIKATNQLDMGTAFDCFSELSNTANPTISKEAQKNRKTLKDAMEKHGFANYDKEWWHYTLKDEHFKDKYFDFVVQ